MGSQVHACEVEDTLQRWTTPLKNLNLWRCVTKRQGTNKRSRMIFSTVCVHYVLFSGLERWLTGVAEGRAPKH